MDDNKTEELTQEAPEEPVQETPAEQAQQAAEQPTEETAEQPVQETPEKPADPYAGMTEKEKKKAIKREKKLRKKEKKRNSKWRGFKRGLACGIIGVLLIEFCLTHLASGKNEGLNLVRINTKIKEIEAYINYTYLYDLDTQDMEDGIFAGLMYGLTEDNYSSYYSKKVYDQEKKRLQGSYKGIGVTITKDSATGGILVNAVNQNGPARRVGIKVGDILMEADGHDLTELDTDQAVGIITGEVGTTVDIKLLRDDEEMSFTVPRENIVTITVQAKVLEDTGIGYISITSFDQKTEDEFADMLDQLTDLDVKGLVIDLRNNGGGDMNVSLDMLDMLLADHLQPVKLYEGEDAVHPEFNGDTLLLSVENKQGDADRYYCGDKSSIDIPIAVIINGNSASASEIFAGTMRDYGYDVVGEKSYGKGIVQSLYQLSDGSAIKFTTHQYRLAGGELIHKKGIEPNIPVKFEPFGDVTAKTVNFANGEEEPDLMEDNQIRAAVEAVQSK